MTQLRTPFRTTVLGPFWSAEVEIAELSEPYRNLALRTLYLSTAPRGPGKNADVLRPGALLALVRPLRVAVAPRDLRSADYVWQRGGSLPPLSLDTPAALEQALREGAVSLLLLQDDPAPPAAASDLLIQLTCIGGTLSLAGLADSGAEARLTADLDLLAPLSSDPAPAARAGAARLPGRVSVHSSGLTIYGRARLPWLPLGPPTDDLASETIAAPFQLALQLPRAAGAAPALRLTLEVARMTEGERRALVDSWATLSAALNPHDPGNGPRRQLGRPVPSWATLAISNPDAPPQLFWPIARWADGPGDLSLARGDLLLLLSDRQPYRESDPPESLARILPSHTSITRAADGTLLIRIREGASPGQADYLAYSARLDANAAHEQATIAAAPLGYAPTEAARLIRTSQGLPEPTWDLPPRARPDEPDAERLARAEPVTPALVWGLVPLADGWAQLPFANLSEQIFVDAGLAQLDAANQPAERRSFTQGAVSFGAPPASSSASPPSEQPWRLTISDADLVSGTWSLRDGWLAAVELRLDRPQLIINGLLWLATEPPTLGDALPDLQNWISGLEPIPLRSPQRRGDLSGDLFPSPLIFALEELTLSPRYSAESAAPVGARLGAWRWSYQLHNPPLPNPAGGAAAGLLDLLLARRVLAAPRLRHELAQALVWRRHPALPMIQTLPLTQNQTPPNYPGASRQLMPCALPLGAAPGAVAVLTSWRFGVGVPGESAVDGAGAWPTLQPLDGDSEPAESWRALPDLPIAALSLPGLILDPRRSAADTGLPPTLGLGLQYRHDLPYTDQINALAQPPKIPRDPTQGAPLANTPPPAPLYPMGRSDYAEHWARLSELAGLAALDAVEALTRHNGAVAIQGLAEPLAWPVRPQADLAGYPGALHLEGDGGDLTLSGEAALRGVSGMFARVDGRLSALAESAAGALALEGGSMAALPLAEDGERWMRDQRGLMRAASRSAGELLLTPLRLEQQPGVAVDLELATSLRPCALRLEPGADAPTWQLWFRDLPLEAGAFARADSQSPLAEDANDPEAIGRLYNLRTGYEWRLAAAPQPNRFQLCGLDFFPLSLSALKISAGRVAQATIIGRLQLPLAHPADTAAIELEDLGNAVAVSFAWDVAAGALRLSEVALADAGSPGEWPLAVAGDELSEAPYLRWEHVTLGRHPSGQAALVFSKARLHFHAFGVACWAAVPAGELHFTRGWSGFSPALAIPAGTDDLAIAAATLTLDPAGAAHALQLDLAVRLGGSAPGADGQPARRAFVATVRYTSFGGATAPQAIAATLFADLTLPIAADQSVAEADDLLLRAGERSLQWAWRRCAAPQEAIFLLPGMRLLAESAPGGAALTFTTKAGEGGLPTFQLASAFVEALLRCRWGAFLQTADPAGAALRDRLFGASAGDLSVGYTSQWLPTGVAVADHAPAQRIDPSIVLGGGPAAPGATPAAGGAWGEGLLLNGAIELKSLIAWPARLAQTPGGVAEIPAARAGGPAASLDHLRHSAQILLNQQALPPQLFGLAPAGDLLFQLFPAADQPRIWSFLAVVEHQLTTVAFSGDPEGAALIAARRWTAVQELRVMDPAGCAAYLAGYAPADRRTIDPQEGLAPLGRSGGGYAAQPLNGLLRAAVQALPPDTLLIDGSGPLWVRRQPAETAPPTLLQFLPSGSQHATLSNPDDLTPSDPHNPAWVLLQLPLLGRLQRPAADQEAAPLRRDTLLALAAARGAGAAALDPLLLALAGWADDRPLQLRLASLDLSPARSFARLDPLSLEESWFRLQSPLSEQALERTGLLPSVSAARPDTPARLSRATALRYAFDTFRPDCPPGSGDRTAYILPPALADDQPRLLPFNQSVGAAVDIAVGRDPLLLFRFNEGGGDTVADSAGTGLTLAIKGAGQWLPGGGLRLSGGAYAASGVLPQALFTALTGSGAISVELQIRPHDLRNTLGRILVISQHQESRNLMLRQGQPDTEAPPTFFSAQIRTAASKDDGAWALQTPAGSLSADRIHLVYTRDAAGKARIYLNGQLSVERATSGGLSTWNPQAQLLLGADLTPNNHGTRFWDGSYFMLAIYNRALDEAEIRRGRAQPYAWLQAGLALAHELHPGLIPSAAAPRHAAASLLPVQLHLPARSEGGPPLENPVPLSLAVSPYLGLEHRLAGEPPVADDALPALRERIIVAEVLTLDPHSRQLRPCASRIWELARDDRQSRSAYEDLRAQRRSEILAWSRQQRDLLAPESPLALLRLRLILQDTSPAAGAAGLVLRYSFMALAGLDPAQTLARRTARLRAAPDRLRFRDGQHGGPQLPPPAQAFELAPPQITGVQPLWLTHRPGDDPEAPPSWPWGLSALRFSVAYTAGGVGVSDSAGLQDASPAVATRWWQAPQLQIQFRSGLGEQPRCELPATLAGALAEGPLPEALRAALAARGLAPAPDAALRRAPHLDRRSEVAWQIAAPGAAAYLLRVQSDRPIQVLRQGDPAAGLPPRFRARAMGSLLPAPPNPRLPAPEPPGAAVSRLRAWQPLLPGTLRMLVLGVRPGALLALRQRLIRQSDGAMPSGSLPVQHRAPRPVPLPANRADRPEAALQTWASAFEPTRGLAVTRDPLDEAFYAACGDQPARRLRLRVVGPARGVLPPDWGGQIRLRFQADTAGAAGPGTLDGWGLRLSLRVGEERFPYAEVPVIDPDQSDRARKDPQLVEYQIAESAELRDRLRAALAALEPGSPILLQAGVSPAGAFTQRLGFTLRAGAPGRAPLPLAAHAIHFEDPEYNRRLASQAGQVVGLARELRGGEPLTTAVTLSSDRRSYNADSELSLRYDWEDGRRDVGGYRFEAQLSRPISSDPPAADQRRRLRFQVSPESAALLQRGQQVILKAGRNSPVTDEEIVIIEDVDPKSRQIDLIAKGDYSGGAFIGSIERLHTVSTTLSRSIQLDDHNPNPRPCILAWNSSIGLLAVGQTLWIKDPNSKLGERIVVQQVQPTRMFNAAVSQPYSANSPVETSAGTLRIRHINANGIVTNLTLGSAGQRELRLPAATLLQLSLRDLQRQSNVRLSPSDALEIRLTVADLVLSLRVEIVAQPVTPTPEAAYALLRREGPGQVSCARFAWGPAPSRVELVCADDLLSGVVRRRAVFQWGDTVRAGGDPHYAIQKITQQGATHIPAVAEKVE